MLKIGHKEHQLLTGVQVRELRFVADCRFDGTWRHVLSAANDPADVSKRGAGDRQQVLAHISLYLPVTKKRPASSILPWSPVLNQRRPSVLSW